MYSTKEEIAFAKQLDQFESAMEEDLNQRAEEVSQKWDFDFAKEQPSLSKNLSWEPIQTVE